MTNTASANAYVTPEKTVTPKANFGVKIARASKIFCPNFHHSDPQTQTHNAANATAIQAASSTEYATAVPSPSAAMRSSVLATPPP